MVQTESRIKTSVRVNNKRPDLLVLTREGDNLNSIKANMTR